MFIFKRSYLASSLVTNGLESSSSFSCDVNIIIPLLSELKQRYLAKLSAFSASFFCLLSSANPYLCMNETYSRRSHPMRETIQRKRLSSFNSITPCWTCLLVYQWLYVIINACLVLFSRLCVLATSSQPNPHKNHCILPLWNSTCTEQGSALFPILQHCHVLLNTYSLHPAVSGRADFYIQTEPSFAFQCFSVSCQTPSFHSVVRKVTGLCCAKMPSFHTVQVLGRCVGSWLWCDTGIHSILGEIMFFPNV